VQRAGESSAESRGALPDYRSGGSAGVRRVLVAVCSDRGGRPTHPRHAARDACLDSVAL